MILGISFLRLYVAYSFLIFNHESHQSYTNLKHRLKTKRYRRRPYQEMTFLFCNFNYPNIVISKMSKVQDRSKSTTTDDKDIPKKNKHNLTALEEQQEKLNRLFDKIDKPVYIPDPPKEKNQLQAPKDFVRNVSGNVLKKNELKLHFMIY